MRKTIVTSVLVVSTCVTLWVMAAHHLIRAHSSGGIFSQDSEQREYEEAVMRNLEHYLEEAYRADGFTMDG